jgi:ATP phosphoribosyltransferase regulatory subunit
VSEKRRLQIPQGTEAFFQEEAKRHRRYTTQLEELFQLWGYLPVKTPAFDFYDSYRPLIDSGMEGRIYRLIDRDGELLMLRSDITLFLAKQIATSLRAEDLPLRVFYSDTILRYQHREDISRNEFFQVGLELIGKPGIDGDAEALILLDKGLSAFGREDYRIHVGSRALVRRIFPENLMQAAAGALCEREFESLSALLLEAGYESDRRKRIVEFLSFIGPIEEFVELLRRMEAQASLPSEAYGECAYLCELIGLLSRLGMEKRFLVDLSESGMQGYYTGIAFQAYLAGADSAVASGGRYDGLLDHFGFSAPSVGFSILQRKIEAFLPDIAPNLRQPERVKGADFADAYRKAEELRRAGTPATI